MIVLYSLVACVLLNRVRGTEWGLPGRSLYYVAPLMGVVAYGLYPAALAVAWALAYFVWAVGPWGRWFDLGLLPDGYGRENKPPSLLERAVEAVSFGSDHIAFFVRNLMVTPGLMLIGWLLGVHWGVMLLLSGLFALGVLSVYALGKQIVPGYHTVFGEYAVGGLWWYLFLLTTVV